MAKPTLAFFLLTITLISGCGGPSFAPAPSPTPQRATPQSFTADQVFPNRTETQHFISQCTDESGKLVQANTWIDVTAIDATHSEWHYTKDQTCAYWQPGVPQAEDWFDLEKDDSGNWYSTGGIENMPQGLYGSAPIIMFHYSVTTKPGYARPYGIVSARCDFSLSTLFDDVVPGDDGQAETIYNQPWKTSNYVENVTTPIYSGPACVSDQWEGTTVHEKWYFAPNIGLVKVHTLYAGGPAADYEMVRVH